MVSNSLKNQAFIPTGMEVVLYNEQEAQKWRECPNNVIMAEPISSWKPKEEFGAAEGDGSTQKRKRCVSEVEEENDIEFSLKELYESNNIQELMSRQQIDETTLDPLELLKILKGWTVKKYKRTETNGRYRVDKKYRHPKSEKWLRSLHEVRKFILDSSHTGKASNSQDAQSNIHLRYFKLIEETFGNGAQPTFNNNSRKGSYSWGEQHEVTGAPKTGTPKTAWGTPFTSRDKVDLSLHSRRPFHYQERMDEKWNVVPQTEQISDSSKQVFSNLTKSNGQECVRTFGVGIPPYVIPQAKQISDPSKQQIFGNLTRSSGQECVRTFGVGLPPYVVPQAKQVSDSSKQKNFGNLTRSSGQECVRTFGVGLPRCNVFGARSSATNITSLDEIKMLVQSQVDAQIEARVAAQVATRISHYEKTQRDMAEKMETMQRLLVLKGILPPSKIPDTHRS